MEAACQQEATWTGALENHFQALEASGRTMSAATRRNTRNNCRVVFRQAEAQGLMPAVHLPPRLLLTQGRKAFDRQQRATAPYQTTYHPTGSPRRFGLPQAQWPPDITQGWQAYQALCGLRIREEDVTVLQKRAGDLPRLLRPYLWAHPHVGRRF